MAGIDDKIAALAFTITTARPRQRIVELIGDAAQIARSNGPSVTVSETEGGDVHGVVKNFARVVLAEFTVRLEDAGGGSTEVTFKVGDVFRTRETLFYVIPISPWTAPGFRTLRTFGQYLQDALGRDAARI